MAYFALMTREQFGKSRRHLRNVIKTSTDGEEFLCRLNKNQDIEDCTTLTHVEMEKHVATSPKWAVAAPAASEPELSSMTKAALIALAKDRGVELPERTTKAKIITALEGN
jgi:hypothetical protein